MKQYTGPMRFAHRGVVQIAPENTLGAFEAAVQRGYEGIEIDIQLSRDGEVVVAHDSNFTRMTVGHPGGGCNERLDTLDWVEIEKIELPFANHLLPEDLPPFARNEALSTLPFLVLGQYGDCDYPTALAKEPRMAHLMRFAEFDAWLAGQRDITIEVEIKAPKMVRKALDIIEKSETPERYILFSGVPEYIDEIQSLCAGGKPKGLRLGANIRFLTDKAKKRVEGMDLFEVGLNDKGFTDEDCAWLKDRGVSVFSNLGDYPEWWSEMCAMDVLGFKTNYPGAFTRWWNGEKP